MDNKIINIKSYTDLELLKRFILQRLNLIDHKKDSISEFEQRLTAFVRRNHNLSITFKFDHTKIEKDLKFKLSLSSVVGRPFTINYEMGNPLNRWYFFETTGKTEEEIENEKRKFENDIRGKLEVFISFLHRLEELGEGKIFIMKS